MKKIKLISDSTCDLGPELLDKLEISLVSLNVLFGDEVYKDLVDLSTEQLYEKVKIHNALPKTSAVTPKVFIDEFRKWTDLGYDILYTGIGSTLSATLNSAVIAKNEGDFDNVYIVDSKNLSSSIGLILLKMDKLRKEGLSAKEIKDYCDEFIVPNVRCSFAIKTMSFLHKGGRCTALTKYLASALRIKPIIKVVNGKLEVGKKPIGSLNKAIKVIFDEAEAIKDKIDPDFIMVTHSLSEECAEYITPFVKTLGVKNVYNTPAGCVISSHCGPGTIGILYILKAE